MASSSSPKLKCESKFEEMKMEMEMMNNRMKKLQLDIAGLVEEYDSEDDLRGPSYEEMIGIIEQSKDAFTEDVYACQRIRELLDSTLLPLQQQQSIEENFEEYRDQRFFGFLNTGNMESLSRLQGIGEKRAKKILRIRQKSVDPCPFKCLDDLEKIGVPTGKRKALLDRFAEELSNEE